MPNQNWTPEELIEQIAAHGINEFLYIIDEASKIKDQRIKNLIRDFVAIDHQQHLIQAGWTPTCPACGSQHIHKNAKAREIQRYKCADCGKRFTAFSGTLLEKSNYTWDIWVEVIQGMLSGYSLIKTQRVLADDFKCVKINTDTIWLMRMKVMAAISALPSPKLSGVVQFDDTFFRENQKSSGTLVNPLPGDILEEREPRYGRQPSQLGIRSPEFATVSTAIDQSKHCVIRLLSMGVVPIEVLYDFIADHTEGISYACSDADGNYMNVFRDMGIPHYIHPSNYWDVIKANGYEQPSKKDGALAEQQREQNDLLLERLWNDGAIDRIVNRGQMTYRQFNQLKWDNGLNLGRVNALHEKLKDNLEKRTRGVSTKLLPLYLAWFEYIHNKEVDEGHALISRKDAEAILLDAIKGRATITLKELNDKRTQPLQLPSPSGRYLHMLMRLTEDVRAKSQNDRFYFGDEDGVETFDRRAIMRRMTDNQLRTLARGVHIRSWREKSRTALVNEMLKQDNLDEIFYLIATGNAYDRTVDPEVSGKPADNYKPKRYYTTHRSPKGLFKLAGMAAASRAKAPLLFLDTETTGVLMDRDEILSIAIVNQDGEVLYDKLIKPENRKSWSKAEKINHISPKDVADAPTIAEEKEEIEAILASAGCIVGWNICFDLRMLYACGVDVPEDPKRRCDLMKQYVKWRRKNDPTYSKDKEKLEEATAYLNLLHNAHNALGDTAVLLDVWKITVGKFPKVEPQDN